MIAAQVKRWTASLITAFLLAGCGATRDVIRLGYAPLSGFRVIQGAGAVTVAVNTVDARGNTGDIGKKVKEVSWSGVIVVENDLSLLVSKALETELARRGFTIGATAVAVAVEIEKFHNEFNGVPLEAVAEVILTVRVTKADGTEVHRSHAKGVSLLRSKTRTGEFAKLSLEASFRDAMRQLLDAPALTDAILEAAGVQPSVGTTSPHTK